MSYLGRSAKLSLKAQEKVSFLATAGQTVKTGLSYTPSFIEVYVNGVLLTDTTDYTATNGNSITFTVALLLNDEVTVISLKTFTVADHYTKSDADTLLAAKAPIASPSFTGNVGINTASPRALLDLGAGSGDGSLSNTTSQYQVVLAAPQGTGDYGRNIGWVEANSNIVAAIIAVDNGTSSSTGLTFSTGNSSAIAEAMRIDSAGIVTKPLQPAFLAYPTVAQQNIAIGVSTIVLNAERFDQGGDFNTGTSTFTAPVTGKYQFNLNIRIGATLDTAAAYYRTYITTSNHIYHPAIIEPNFTADLNYYNLCFSVLADMDAGDTAYAQVQQSGGGVKTDIDSSPENTNFSGYLAC